MTLQPAVFVTAYAKVNLTLEIVGRREDGYHELVSVMQTISLHDTLLVRPNADGAFALTCDVPELATDQNLALLAAQRLADEAGGGRGAMIDLHKEIPAQAGLGGGSSDAAHVLMALASVWDVRLPHERLAAIAAALGSDVPFFLAGGTALVTGRGEHIAPLPDAEPLWLVLVKPPVAVPTAGAFRALTADAFDDGTDSLAVSDAIRRREPLPLDRLVNGFEASILSTYPAGGAAWEALRSAGAPIVRLSGSGPTIFAPFRTLRDAAGVCDRVRADGHAAWLAHTITRAETAAGTL